jgi:hypothetical protein
MQSRRRTEVGKLLINIGPFFVVLKDRELLHGGDERERELLFWCVCARARGLRVLCEEFAAGFVAELS